MARPVSISPVNCTLIRKLLSERDVTVREFRKMVARRLNIKLSEFNESAFYQMLRGERPINDERLAAMEKALHVPFGYLKTSTGQLAIQKVDRDVLDWSLTEERHDAKETTEYLDICERMGWIDFQPETIIDETGVIQWDFWKKDSILPFRSPKAEKFWEFQGDEIIIRGPARCGKSTLALEWLITLMLKNAGMQVMIARAFGVDLDSVRQNIIDLVKYKFSDPLSSIRVRGGAKFHTVEINGGEIHLQGIDRPGSQMGAGYDVILFSQAEQIRKDKVDQIASRCTPASQRWIEDGKSRSMILYDVNPNRIDHWIETLIAKGIEVINFDFVDHPAYFTEDGEETQLYKDVYKRLDKLEGVWRQRLLEGKAANAEGTIFELKPCHILDELPANFERDNMFYRGFDFGMKDPNVILWFGVHRQTGDVTVCREWRRVNVDTIFMGEEAKRYSAEPVLMTVIDNDENLQSILQKNCGIVSELAQKGPNSVASGIALTQHRLKLAEQGEPGGLYIYNNPVVRDPVLIQNSEPLTILDEADLYAWHENSDKPIDKHNHAWDIVRYMLDYLETQPAAVGFGGAGAKRRSRV